MTDAPATTELLARARRLADLEEIRQLFSRYKRALDGKDFAAYVSLFTDDGEFIAGDMHARGRGEIKALVDGMVGDLLGEQDGTDFHVVLNPIIDIDGDRAVTEVTWLYVVRDDADRPYLAKVGHYEDVVVRDTDGRWRFRTRQAPTDIPVM